MGISAQFLEFIESTIRTQRPLAGTRMLELGNQQLDSGAPCKPVFEGSGIEHVSVDLNGRDGAIPIDLSQPSTDWPCYFDVVTNSGTTEHVEPFEGQYEAFKNIHNWLKVGGLAIHNLPDGDSLQESGTWRGHCNNSYSVRFVRMLAAGNSYDILHLDVVDGMTVFVLRKSTGREFMADRSKFLSEVIRKEGGQRYVGWLRSRGLFPKRSTLMRLARRSNIPTIPDRS